MCNHCSTLNVICVIYNVTLLPLIFSFFSFLCFFVLLNDLVSTTSRNETLAIWVLRSEKKNREWRSEKHKTYAFNWTLKQLIHFNWKKYQIISAVYQWNSPLSMKLQYWQESTWANIYESPTQINLHVTLLANNVSISLHSFFYSTLLITKAKTKTKNVENRLKNVTKFYEFCSEHNWQCTMFEPKPFNSLMRNIKWKNYFTIRNERQIQKKQAWRLL